MAQVIEAVTSGTLSYSANSYCTLAYADAYHALSLEGLWWQEQPAEDRERALISATRAIEALLRGQDADKYDSVRTTSHPDGQPLQFPRSWDVASGTLLVPTNAKHGQCLLALHVLKQHKGAAGITDGEEMARLGLRVSTTDGVFASRWLAMPRYWPQDVKDLVFPYWKRDGETTEGPADYVPEPFDQWIAQT